MEQIYAVFRSRIQALDCAERLRKYGVAAQAVATPREANAGCGLSARFSAADFPRARRIVAQAGYSAFAGFCRVGRGYLSYRL